MTSHENKELYTLKRGEGVQLKETLGAILMRGIYMTLLFFVIFLFFATCYRVMYIL